MRFLLLILSLILVVTACKETPKTVANRPFTEKSLASLGGCYLGDADNPADSLELRIESGSPEEIRGHFRIRRKEKDQRAGTIHGIRGADGIYRTTFRFMQEGITDSIQLHFRDGWDNVVAIELRPSAYDPATGREYPDSSKPFSIRLERSQCDDANP